MAAVWADKHAEKVAESNASLIESGGEPVTTSRGYKKMFVTCMGAMAAAIWFLVLTTPCFLWPNPHDVPIPIALYFPRVLYAGIIVLIAMTLAFMYGMTQPSTYEMAAEM